MRPLQNLVRPSQLIEQLERGRMHRVASEVPIKILVLLQEQHRDPFPGQQSRQHQPRRSTADDAAGGLADLDDLGGLGLCLWRLWHAHRGKYVAYRVRGFRISSMSV